MNTGLFDKHGTEIKIGDVIEIHQAYRSTQTHYGENIPHPSGEYTEQLEPEIRTIRETVKWGDGMAYITNHQDCGKFPLFWDLRDYKTRDDLINDFGNCRNWVDPKAPGEDDLGYLLREYPPNTEEELMAYLSSCEIIE